MLVPWRVRCVISRTLTPNKDKVTRASLDWAVCSPFPLPKQEKTTVVYQQFKTTHIWPPAFCTEYRNMRTCEVPFVRNDNNSKKKTIKPRGLVWHSVFLFKNKMELFKKNLPSSISGVYILQCKYQACKLKYHIAQQYPYTPRNCSNYDAQHIISNLQVHVRETLKTPHSLWMSSFKHVSFLVDVLKHVPSKTPTWNGRF